MGAFLNDITAFYGTGDKNEQGQDLESFLQEYDPNKYPNPSVTADVMVFRYNNTLTSIYSGLKLLLIQRKNHPSIGYWALPGGFVDIREDIDAAAKRELLEETGIDGLPIQQMHCFGEVNRDPRTRIITVSYLALVEEELILKAGDDAADALWFDVSLKKENEEVVNNNRKKQYYELTLINYDREIELNASIEYSQNVKGIIKEPEFKVLKTNHIAFDHPSFILQGLLFLEANSI